MNRGIWAALAMAGLLACESTTPAPRVSLSVIGTNPGLTVGSNSLVITKAEIVLRKIELEGVGVADCGGGPDQSPQADEEANPESGDDGDCEEFKAGPIRVLLSLTSVNTLITLQVPPGTYKEIEFKVHPVTGEDPMGAAFRAANPDLDGLSIRVEGTYNGVPFVFTSNLDAEQELELQPNLVVTEGTATNLTLQVDLSTWFKSAAGEVIDPATAGPGGVNAEVVKNNIKSSFRALEDEDKDGHEDEDH